MDAQKVRSDLDCAANSGWVYKVKNLPDYYRKHPYIVVRLCEDGLWFYGGYDTVTKACEVAEKIGNGKVYLSTELESA